MMTNEIDFRRDSKIRPVLTADEEKTLFLKYAAATDQKSKIAIRNQIVEHNIRLVFNACRDFHGTSDLASEGTLGLIRAVEMFDLSKELKFSTYAMHWIRAYLFKYVRDNHRLVRNTATGKNKKLFYNLSKVKRALQAEGLEATPALIAERLQVTKEDVEAMQIYLLAEMSFDAPLAVGDDAEDCTLYNFVSSEAVTPDSAFEEAHDSNHIANAINQFRSGLEPLHLRVFNECMLGEAKFVDIARDVGLSRERIRQINNKIEERFRKFCLREGLDEFILKSA